MSDTEPDVPSGTAQQSPSVMASSSVSTNAMAMTPGIMPPGKLNVTSTENMAENWKVWKQMWNNYVIIAKLGTQPPEYKVALSLHCIGVDALKIFNGFQFDTPEDRNNLSEIIEKFDQYTIGELNETFERYNFHSRNQEENESIVNASMAFSHGHILHGRMPWMHWLYMQYTPVYFKYPCIPLNTLVYPCLPLYTPVYPCIPLSTLVYPCLPLYTPVYP